MLASLLIGLVIVVHVYIVVLEMLLWDKPFGRRVFRTTPEFAAASKALAANQGLYNGFLAAGLVWGLMLNLNGMAMGRPVEFFFLTCVLLAGCFGAATVGIKILYVQALPAALALAALLIAR